jgi:hypothetical protein
LQLEQVSGTLHAEGQSMLQAAIITSPMGCHSVIFETDFVVLKQAVTTVDYELFFLGAIFR